MNNYNAITIANFIIWFVNNKTSNRTLTPLKLQKILYYVQANHLALSNGQPLFSDAIEKWQYGPVVPSVYHEFKDFGINHIPITRCMIAIGDSGEFEILDFAPTLVDPQTQAEVGEVVNHLINQDPFELVNRTHSEHMWLAQQNLILGGAKGLTYDNQELTQFFQQNPVLSA